MLSNIKPTSNKASQLAKEVIKAYEEWRLYVETFSSVDSNGYAHSKIEDEKQYLGEAVKEGEKIINDIKYCTRQTKHTKAMNDFEYFVLYNTKRMDDFFEWIKVHVDSGDIKSSLDK